MICNRTASYAATKICGSRGDRSSMQRLRARPMSGNGDEGVIAESTAAPSDIAVLAEGTSIASNR
jgi:hypothetical protein